MQQPISNEAQNILYILRGSGAPAFSMPIGASGGTTILPLNGTNPIHTSIHDDRALIRELRDAAYISITWESDARWEFHLL